MKQLLTDMRIPIREIAGDKKKLGLFTNQFSARVNNGKSYKVEDIATALGDLAD